MVNQKQVWIRDDLFKNKCVKIDCLKLKWGKFVKVGEADFEKYIINLGLFFPFVLMFNFID